MHKADTIYGTKIEWQKKGLYGIDFSIAQGVVLKASEGLLLKPLRANSFH